MSIIQIIDGVMRMTELYFVCRTETIWYVAKLTDSAEDIIKIQEMLNRGDCSMASISLEPYEVYPYTKKHFCIIADFPRKLLAKHSPYFKTPDGWTEMQCIECYFNEIYTPLECESKHS
jgi:hypothetical protein